MPRLTPEEAEDAARVIEELFADLDDLRGLARSHPLHDAERIGIRTRESIARVTLLNVMTAATGGDLLGEDEGVRALAMDAVSACLPILPLNGSGNHGYEPSPSAYTETTVMAQPQEWLDAAYHIAQLHRRLEGLDALGDSVHRPGEHGADEDREGADHGRHNGAPEDPQGGRS